MSTRVKPVGWAFGELLTSAQLSAVDLGQANSIDGVTGGSYTPSGAIIIGGAGLQVGVFTTSGNTTLGSDETDTLTVNAESTFIGDAAFDVLTVADGLTVNAPATFTDEVLLGNSSADAITIRGTLTIENGCTIGTSTGDTLQVESSTTFDGPVTFNGPISIDDLELAGNLDVTGDAAVSGNVSLGSGSGDDVDINGIAILHQLLSYTFNGRVGFRAATLTDANTTLQVIDGNLFRIPDGNTTNRTYTLGTTDAEDGDFMIFYTAPGFSLPFDVTLNSPTSAQDITFVGGTDSIFAVFTRTNSEWIRAFYFNNA